MITNQSPRTRLSNSLVVNSTLAFQGGLAVYTMSVEANVAQHVHHAATRITQLLQASPDDAAAGVDEFVAACSALPSGQSAINLASVLKNHSVASFCRLETAAVHRFQMQLQLRPLSGGSTKMPRALAELRSAARAWSVPPLVLLAEFSHAPTSDNFWRLLSKLARSSRSRSWPADRKRLLAARHRRCHDLSARRKGVSHVQPWAIPDVVFVLHEEEPEPVGQCQEAVKSIGGQAGTVAMKAVQSAQTHIANDDGDDDEATSVLPREARRQQLSSQRSPTHLEARRVDDDYENADGQDREDSDDGGDWSKSVQMKDSDSTSIWQLSYGWWLPSDIVGRLCVSLAQVQPNFAVIGIGSPCAAPPRQPDATLVIPLQIKMQHWILATVCLPEKVISVYDPLSLNKGRPSQSDRNITGALEHVFSKQRPAEDTTRAVSDCSIVVRSCPTQTKGIDSGVATIALSLYCLVGRAMPQTLDSWLWRRMLSHYLAQLPSHDAAQTANNIAMASTFSVNHTALYEHINPTKPFSCRSRIALHNDAMEGRAVWMAAARLADNAKADAQSRRYNLECEPEHSRPAALESRLETAVQAVEACTSITAVANGIRAVLDDLDRLLAFLAAPHA